MCGYLFRITRLSQWAELAGAKITRSSTLPSILESSFYPHRLVEGGRDPAEAELAGAGCLGLCSEVCPNGF